MTLCGIVMHSDQLFGADRQQQAGVGLRNLMIQATPPTPATTPD
jgi:hypothetical protein